MKKTIMLLAGALMLMGSASAQNAIVKDALKSISPSSKPEAMKTVLGNLKPVFEDSEASKEAATWFAAGKASYVLFDQLSVAKQLGNNVDSKEMCQALLDGTFYLEKALSLDTIMLTNKDGSPKIDKKTGLQKTETKYSKEILSLLSGHVQSYAEAGNLSLASEDYESVEKFFGYFADQVKNINSNYPDSALAEIRFFEGYGAYQAKHYKNAFDAFSKSIKLGYTANQIKDFHYSSFTNFVQNYVDEKDFDSAEKATREAMNIEPTNSNYPYMLGYILETKTKDPEMSIEYFQKSLEIDPNNSGANYAVGLYYAKKAEAIEKDNSDLLQDKLLEKTKPVYEEALKYLEKAYYELNNNDAKALLALVYYKLGNEEKYQEITK